MLGRLSLRRLARARCSRSRPGTARIRSSPKLPPSDEFLEYGIAGWELRNLTLHGKLTPEMMPTSFVRGLEHEAKLGVNPFKSGIIGSSDAHNALPFVEEDNFFGKFPGQEPRADRWKYKSSVGESEGGEAPTFLVAALKDPQGANLDRIQVIKGWLDGYGTAQEKAYDVVWSGDRKPGPGGKLPSVGDTVDVARATYSNTIGAAELTTVWQDPDFKPGQRAFYYARVIEHDSVGRRACAMRISGFPRWTSQRSFATMRPRDSGACWLGPQSPRPMPGTRRWPRLHPVGLFEPDAGWEPSPARLGPRLDSTSGHQR